MKKAKVKIILSCSSIINIKLPFVTIIYIACHAEDISFGDINLKICLANEPLEYLLLCYDV